MKTESFSDIVRRLRHSKGLSQSQVATSAGISNGYIGSIETGDRGKRPSRDIVVGIAQGLHATPAERQQLLAAAGYGNGGATPGRPTFDEFVMGDPDLRHDQKQALIAAYRSYTRGLRATPSR